MQVVSGARAWSQMGRDPLRQLTFCEVACGELQEGRDAFGIRRDELAAIEFQEKFGDDHAGALVAVEERVIARDAEGIAGGEPRERALAIDELMPWAGQGRLQQAVIGHAGLAAVFGDLRVVDGERDRKVDPGRLALPRDSLTLQVRGERRGASS